MLLLLALVLPQAAPESFLYLSVAAEKRIAVYRASGESGAVTHIADAKLPAEPAALAVARDGKLLVASLRSSGQLASLARDPQTGKLTLLNVVEAGPDPAHLSIDRAGRHVFTAYYVAAKVTVHGLDDAGKLSEKPLASVSTADKAHAAVLSPDERFLFVPHTGSEAIFQFRWDAAAGSLTANNPPKLSTKPGTGPRHMSFHPRLPVAYVSNEQGGSITAYRLDEKTGLLSSLATAATLPPDFTGQNATAEIRVHPSGKWVYCANRGHNSLARFTLDPATGAPTLADTTPTEPVPRSFDIPPDGRWLYAAGESTGKLAAFRIDADTGRLTRSAAMEIGPKLWWVLCVP